MITIEKAKRKILVVDDDLEIVKMISLVLRDQDIDVITAFNGREAIEKVRSGFPELILLDLNLPDMNGREIMKKTREINEDIAFIVVTGFGGEQIAIDLMKAGAVDFISKPFDTERLIKSITDAFSLRDSKIEDKRDGELSSLEKFFPFLAHEIRNPLHAIAGALAIIQRRANLKDETVHQSVKIIQEEVQHLTEFVQECLDFVRPPVHKHFIEGDINDIVSIVLNMMHHMYDELYGKIKITTQLGLALPKVHINYEEIKQALLNILKNSFEAMPEGGELLITTSLKSKSSPKFIEITFRDTGSGIEKEKLISVFQPFFTTKSSGTGLGLPICHRIIVDRHNGNIGIESERGMGTKVTVELPIQCRMAVAGGNLS
jgi:signal transduction histidine kinase